MKRRNTLMLAAAMGILLSAQVGGAAESRSEKAGSSKISEDDAEFVREAASGGMMEVQLGKLAAERASNAQVKQFGSRMQKEHTKANDALKKIAAKKNIKLPAELESEHKSKVNKLSKLKGREFDREYMELMVDDHKEDIEKFEEQAKEGKDPELKKFAQDHVPILKKHLELAQQTRKQVSSEKGK